MFGLIGAQGPTFPPALQTLGGLGTFLLGAAGMGWVGIQAYKTFKRNGPSGAVDNGAAERRTNSAAAKIIERIDRNYELTRTEVGSLRVAVADDLQKTRHALRGDLTAPVLELGRELSEVKEILIQIRERLPMRGT
jgi:hypothetical protein